MNLTRKPRGAYARRLRRLVEAVPALETFESFVAVGNHLHVQARWCHGVSPSQRVAAVTLAAQYLGVPVQSMAGGAPRKVSHWATSVFDGGTVIVGADICECHDGLDATLGHFPDRDQVIAKAVGQALREIVPVEYHPLIAEAEVLIDTATVLKGASQ